jgi:hypothetical protein
VSGGWLQLVLLAQRRPVTEPWRLWFNGGLVVGAIGAALLGSGLELHGYGDLSVALPAYALVPLLALVGLPIGYGALSVHACGVRGGGVPAVT